MQLYIAVYLTEPAEVHPTSAWFLKPASTRVHDMKEALNGKSEYTNRFLVLGLL